MAKPRIINTIRRKAGDRLILHVTFDGKRIPGEADWAGATAKLHIRPSNSSTPFLTNGDVVIDTAKYPREGEYRGAMPPEGTYYYEIEVAFSDTSISPVTWPNGGLNELIVGEQIA